MNQWEEQYKKKGFHAQRRYPNENLIRFLAANFPPKRQRILELGCGSGANLWAIAKEGYKAYGIDNSPTAIKLCSKMIIRWGVSANIGLADMVNLPFTDNFFDGIVDIFSVEHISLAGHKKVYKEVYRCLKKDGLFFQWHLGSESVSFKKSGGKKIDKFTVDEITNYNLPYNHNGLTCFINPEEAKKMLQQAGFRDIIIERHTRTYKQMKQLIEYFAITAKK